jgi:hypothetical protein
VKVLVLCPNERCLGEAVQALQIPAMYRTWFSALTGYRFDKIIVIRGGGVVSAVEAEVWERLIKEDLPTHLTRDGKIFLL